MLQYIYIYIYFVTRNEERSQKNKKELARKNNRSNLCIEYCILNWILELHLYNKRRKFRKIFF